MTFRGHNPSAGPTLPVRLRPGEDPSRLPPPASRLPAPGLPGHARGFTIVEVMMASVILVVGFMGMIQAVTIGSEMLATARRTTLAVQILNHEMEKLRLDSWSNIKLLDTTTTWNSGSAYSVNEEVRYQGGWFVCLQPHSNHTPTEGNYWAAASSNWNVARSYSFGDVVQYSTDGNWYRYINTLSSMGNNPTLTSHWAPYSGPLTLSNNSGNPIFSLTRIVTEYATDLREVTFVVSWQKSGTTTAASTPTGSLMDQLTFSRPTPVSRTYTRSTTSWFTQHGLNHAIQRS